MAQEIKTRQSAGTQNHKNNEETQSCLYETSKVDLSMETQMKV